jgi:hypothetical protein
MGGCNKDLPRVRRASSKSEHKCNRHLKKVCEHTQSEIQIKATLSQTPFYMTLLLTQNYSSVQCQASSEAKHASLDTPYPTNKRPQTNLICVGPPMVKSRALSLTYWQSAFAKMLHICTVSARSEVGPGRILGLIPTKSSTQDFD